MTASDSWYLLENPDDVPSPALLVYPERVERNIGRMISYAGGVDRIRPHVKTHKMAELIRMQVAAGIRNFKGATIAEAEMTARAGAAEFLLAYSQAGPNLGRFARLAAAFPEVKWSTVTDDPAQLKALSSACATRGVTIEVLVDIDNGMHRTGIEPSMEADALYRQIGQLPGLVPGGLHVYDGHLAQGNFALRLAEVLKALEPVDALVARLKAEGLPVPRVVIGGSASFPIHARRPDLVCSPGTTVFWDYNYQHRFPELEFELAALVFARVISHPGPNRLCVDLGYKAISADQPQPRVHFLNLGPFDVVSHSEEHLTIESPAAERFAIGDVLYGVPSHICPTVALYQEAVTVRGGRAGERWPVTARDRRLEF